MGKGIENGALNALRGLSEPEKRVAQLEKKLETFATSLTENQQKVVAKAKQEVEDNTELAQKITSLMNIEKCFTGISENSILNLSKKTGYDKFLIKSIANVISKKQAKNFN